MRFSERLRLALLVASAGFPAAHLSAQEVEQVAVVEEAAVVEDGRRITIEYTLTLDDGTVVESRTGEDAVEYEHGDGPLWKALQSALVGLAPGESTKVTLTPEQGFGSVKPELFNTVPAAELPEDTRVVGAELTFTSAQGQRVPVRVHELKGDEIVVDANHPLAGKTIHFDVQIVSVE